MRYSLFFKKDSKRVLSFANQVQKLKKKERDTSYTYRIIWETIYPSQTSKLTFLLPIS